MSRAKPKIAVIGAGMMGASAARHLALAGARVTLIGPKEPAPGGAGPYASHHDAGRITRSLASDPLWAELAQASIARYRALEASSGVRFFNEQGALFAGPVEGPGAEFMAATEQVARDMALPHQRLEGEALANALPMFRFPEGTLALWEPKGAGTIDPRAYLEASNIVAERAGLVRITQAVIDIEQAAGALRLRLTDGATVIADRAVLATGAYGDGLWPLPAPLTRFGRTVLMMTLNATQMKELGPMPSLLWQPPRDEVDYYLLPPVRYPDGSMRLKIGGDPEDLVLKDHTQINDWFRSGGSKEVGAHLETRLREVMPGLPKAPVALAACVTSFTPDSRPLLAQDGLVTLCLGGNGAAAKSGDEIGRRAALLALREAGSEDLVTAFGKA